MKVTKENSTRNSGLYACFKDELQAVIDDIEEYQDDDLFIISVKTCANITVYSFPATISKINKEMDALLDSIRNEEVVKVGTTWINTKNIVTARVCVFIGGCNNGY